MRLALRSLWLVAVTIAAGAHDALAQTELLTGAAAFGDWHMDRPGLSRIIKPADLPTPGTTPSVANFPHVIQRGPRAIPQAPAGFKVELFAEGLSGPREIRVAPNGDIFIAETREGRVRVLRAADGDSRPSANEIFASGLNQPFGIAFFPAGNNPRWVYIANTDGVVRFRYVSGDLRASGSADTVAGLPGGGGHSTRNLVFTLDDRRMLVSVGSRSNDAEGIGSLIGNVQAWFSKYPLGASLGTETNRAAVLAFDPAGNRLGTYATGIRNCAGLAVHPINGDVYCSVNERDGLGDDLVPDYVTRVREGAFYGWPWFYVGNNQDPRHRGERSDLKGRITVPDVLIQAHSAPLGLVFYDGKMFPSEYHGDGFVAEHGSWNRSRLTGYKVVRVRLKDGSPTGEYQDFLTGFVVSDSEVWGRPVGVAVAHDGALLVSEDANGTIWRISY